MMLAACLLSLAMGEPVSAPAAEVADILRVLAQAGGLHRDEARRALATLPARGVVELMRASVDSPPQVQLSVRELIAVPGAHWTGVLLAALDGDERVRTCAADVLERLSVRFQDRLGLDGVETGAMRLKKRVFPVGMVLGSRRERQPCLGVLIDHMNRFAIGADDRPILLSPELAAQPVDFPLYAEPAEVMLQRLLSRTGAQLERLPSCQWVAPAQSSPPRDRDSGTRQLQREHVLVRGLLDSLRLDATPARRCMALVNLVRLGLFGCGKSALECLSDQSLSSTERALALDILAASAAVPSGEDLDDAAPVLLAALPSCRDPLEHFLLVEGLCTLRAEVVCASIVKTPALLERSDVVHVVGRLRLPGLLTVPQGAAIEPTMAFELCEAAARLGEPTIERLEGPLVTALSRRGAAELLARYRSWAGGAPRLEKLAKDPACQEFLSLLEPVDPLVVIATSAPLDQRLREVRRYRAASGDAANAVIDAVRERFAGWTAPERVLGVALVARAFLFSDRALKLLPVEQEVFNATLRGALDVDAFEWAEVAADIGQPIATDLIVRVVETRPEADVLARACLALEREGVRLALEENASSLQHLLEQWNKDHRIAAIDALASPEQNGTLWGYAIAEEAGRVTVLLQEMETFNP
jgi:hypothetical protein